jgi:hypothetical protein
LKGQSASIFLDIAGVLTKDHSRKGKKEDYQCETCGSSALESQGRSQAP